jgi:hypothetical protein
MRYTKANIGKRIEEVTGLPVRLWKGDGYFYFYSDDDECGAMLSSLWHGTSVYVNALWQIKEGKTDEEAIQWWVDQFYGILNAEDYFAREKWSHYFDWDLMEKK